MSSISEPLCRDGSDLAGSIRPDQRTGSHLALHGERVPDLDMDSGGMWDDHFK